MARSIFQIELAKAVDPLVLAVDIGSTASRGSLHDAHGRPVGQRVKVPHAFSTAGDGTSTIDPDQVLAEVIEIIDGLAAKELKGRIGGVALDTFASSVIGVDRKGLALTPCYTYADTRSAQQVAELRRVVDEDAVHDRIGVRLHASYLPARLRWLSATDPLLFDRVDRWLSLGEYLHLHLLGRTAVGTSTASWSGLLDRRTGKWDAEMLTLCGISTSHLSSVRDPDRPLSATDNRLDQRWPALRGAKWFPAISDGLGASVGAGATDSRTIGASAATTGALRVMVSGPVDQVPSGLWCYRVDRNRSLLGGAVNDVGRAVTWATNTLALPDEPLVSRALLADPTEDTPLVLPFFTGERSTGWAAHATALMSGVRISTEPMQLYRGVLEGVGLTYRRIGDQLVTRAPGAVRILAQGRVTQDRPEILQILADVMGRPVAPVTIKRATLHGSALLALETLAPNLDRTPPDMGTVFEPHPRRTAYYTERMGRFNELYDKVIADSTPATS
ncbi:gluconokinase [Raineyella antarctica]|uniref:Gluconokinase n=1 Tax=Raineyella antarctica TaxID=1577474 RepID=A0A1G6H8T4_9ACTN|nr:gluconokinase [Raineyella antarctica]SDB90563.1 gluconokinase [Raineyella antarctica]